MPSIRTFRNTDPPKLVEIWNEAFPNRGAVRLNGSLPLEQYVFAKATFDPQGFFVAEEGDVVLGFGHAALSQAPDDEGPVGVVCAIAVRASARSRGVGSDLLRHAEQYLSQRGAKKIQAGGYRPHNPFYTGLYGGCELPGILESERLAEPFFLHRGYQVQERVGIFQRSLSLKLNLVDTRFQALRQRFDLQAGTPRTLQSWWRECCIGAIDPIELIVVDRSVNQLAGRCYAWEMEGFAHRWGKACVGIFDFEVLPPYRRSGLGKLFLTQLMKQFQDQFFEIVEIHLPDSNRNAVEFLTNLQYQKIESGQVFAKKVGTEP